MIRPLLTALAVAGCAAPADPVVSRGTEEIQARDIVWHELFQAEGDAPTVVWWYDTCPDHPGNPRSAVYLQGTCYSGLFREALWQADVAWRGSYSKSAYAHELMHAWQAERGIHDPDHKTAEWRELGRINAELKKLGL
jgi:hypothetical protein